MFGDRFSRRPEAKAASPPSVPDGVVVHAIGDVHGHAELLVPLLGEILEDAAAAADARSIVVFLGDYVDRGPSSRGVIDILLALSAEEAVETRFLLGNHELALLEFLEAPSGGQIWFELGGRETLASYGVQARLPLRGRDWEALRDAFAQALPPEHLDFLRRLPPAWEIGDYFFVHAGARPGVSLDAQSPQDLLWIRQPFLGDERAFEKVVVHGHTPAVEVHLDHRRIGIDTGAYATGVLSSIRLEGDRRLVRQARRGPSGEVSVETRDV